ncbi:hemin uptake protein HemP [Pukyongiella litopenaei]|uniref:Hemin uptake protein HemP n=1 Tax=Pukyongiella litopenaei TaxID=2605946 RepID=A0A2S0MMA2_9RHOB|nr:hemin uptake protein HemP [Pukyongiella litopenaei]
MTNMAKIIETSAVPALPTYDATDLTGGGPLANIVLNGMVYSLRITRAGKLILTK